MHARHTVLVLSAAVTAALVGGNDLARATDYRFVRIADTREGGFFLDSSRHAAINNAGTVVMYKGLPGAVAGFFSGTGGAHTTIVTTDSGPLAGFSLDRPSLNDSGQIAFHASMATPDGNRFYRVDPGGAVTLIAQSGSGTFNGMMPNVAINNSGRVAFSIASSGALDGLYYGDGTSNTKIYGGGGIEVSSGPSLNNSGTSSFASSYAPVGGVAHLKGAGGTPSVIASNTVNGLSILAESVISDGGLVVFGGTRHTGPQGIFTGSGSSVITTFVDTDGPYSNLPIFHGSFGAPGYPTMNNTGKIAFVGNLDAGGQGIFTGADPTTSAVLKAGDPLFGGVVAGIFGGLGREAINDAGEIAFQAALSDFSGDVIVKAIPARAMKWEDDSDGVWSDDANWLGPVPNAYHHDANFTDAITAPRTVTVDGAFTVGSINFDNTNRYTVSGGGAITLDDSYVASVNVLSGSHVISAALTPARDTTIVTAAGSGLTASNLQATSKRVVKDGLGTLAVNRVVAGAMHVAGGTVTILSNGTDSGVSQIGTLTIVGALAHGLSGTLDLSDNDLIVQNGSYSAVAGAVAASRNGGAWDMPGLTSSAARDHVADATMLGVMTGTEYGTIYGAGALFGPFATAATDTLVKYTWYGDADFNGLVDFDDYVRTDAGFNFGLSGWVNGDFDLNGLVDFDDYVLIDLGFNSQSGTLRQAIDLLEGRHDSARSLDSPALRMVASHFQRFGDAYAHNFLASVPEPTSLLSTGGVTLVTLLRRQRRVR